MIDSPQGEAFRFGSEVPAPIFKDIVDRIAGKDLGARKPINGSLLSHSTILSNVGSTKELTLLYQRLKLPIPAHVDAAANWGSLTIRSSTESQFQPCNRLSAKLAYANASSYNALPDVLHIKLCDALFLLEKHGLSVIVEGNIHGTVCKQSNPAKNEITILLQ